MDNKFTAKHTDQTQPEFNEGMMNVLATDMHNLLSKYILDCLLWKYSDTLSPPQPNSYIRSDYTTKNMSLMELAQQKRKEMIAPVPVYPTSEKIYEKSEIRERTESVSTNREDGTPVNTLNGSDTSHQKFVEFSDTNKREVKRQKKTKEELKKIKMDLAFDNESGDLATRCDVVYKTILRDFRRFFLDNYKLYKQKKGQGLDMSDSLFQFTMGLFPNKSMRDCKTLSLDLGCLLFPKEMTKDLKILKEIEKTNHFGLENDNKIHEIMRIHGFLYKFSIDKIEECYQNLSLCKWFLYYVEQTRDSRINSNPTMNKNASIYLKARSILEEKALNSLSL